MTARVGRGAGMLVMAAVLPLAGCDDGDRTGGGDAGGGRAAAATKAARAYQQAQLDQSWEAVCEARTERLLRSWGADTVAECVRMTSTPRVGGHADLPVSTGEALELPAFGPHPAGIGLRVTVGTAAGGMHIDTALRLVPGDRGAWLVDDARNLGGDVGPEAVRAALERE
ncbi:hypothetical protein [Streptomyces sp. NPDC060184]|uniref:hypothetical protein n=1 Tax=Streptomyces sp. NPDC060184 TaxID=3347064 RepID=UPI00365502C3